jgi:3-methylfumaryl-CoA hydratase
MNHCQYPQRRPPFDALHSCTRENGVDLDIEYLAQWIGRSESLTDSIGPTAAASLAATLDHPAAPAAGDPLPPLWHWIAFNPIARQSELGPDGHPRRGGFLPPVPLPRRMWAGSRFAFTRPLKVGEPVAKLSTIRDVRLKEGRSGKLVFVVVEHVYSASGGEALREEHDIVYREAAAPDVPAAAPKPAPTDAAWTRSVVPDPVLLFRYSALTFNGHRIHYDRSYAMHEEGYPGLVFHGPLQGTLLLDLLLEKQPDATVTGFTFRALWPVFDTAPLTLNGTPGDDGRVRLWIAGPNGELCMDATATLS